MSTPQSDTFSHIFTPCHRPISLKSITIYTTIQTLFHISLHSSFLCTLSLFYILFYIAYCSSKIARDHNDASQSSSPIADAPLSS